jgi:hypothetical protein
MEALAQLQHFAGKPEERWLPETVPGVVGMVRDGILEYSQRPHVIAGLVGGLSVTSLVMGRKVMGPRRSATALYQILLAGTASGKDDPLQFVNKLIIQSGFGQWLGPNSWGSVRGLCNSLAKKPKQLQIVDEFGDQLAYLTNQMGNLAVTNVTSMIKDLYTPWDTCRTSEIADMASIDIHAPSLTILGAGVQDAFFEALRQKDLTGGLANRLVVSVITKPGPLAEEISEEVWLPTKLTKAVKAMPHEEVRTPRKMREIMEDGADPPPNDADLYKIGWTDEAKDNCLGLVRAIGSLPLEEGDRDLLGRAGENAARIALNIAGGDGPREIIGKDLRFGIWMVFESFRNMKSGVAEHMVESWQYGKVRQKVYFWLLRQPGKQATWRSINRQFGSKLTRPEHLKAALNQLAAEGRVTQVEENLWRAIEDE